MMKALNRIALAAMLLITVASTARAQSTTWAMQTNEVGVVIHVLPNPASGGSASLAGATAWLRSEAPTGTVSNFALTIVSADGTDATCGASVSSGTCGNYTTRAGDFPIEGNYNEELIASYSAGALVLHSLVGVVSVGNSLPGTP